MSDEDPARAIGLALDIADGALADRLAALLAGVPGLYLVAAGDPADAIIAQPTASAQRANEDRAAYGLPIDTTLTARELEVLALLAEGASNKMIARRLAISVHTAKFHVASVIDKLDAIGRTDAVAHAARLGIIEHHWEGDLIICKRTRKDKSGAIDTVLSAGSAVGSLHAPIRPKPAITLSRKDWHSSANGAVL